MYHSSPVEIKEIKSGLYGAGLFFGNSSACGFGSFVYELDQNDISVCSTSKLRREFDETEPEVVVFASKWEIDAEAAFDVITGKDSEYDYIAADMAGVAGWEAQSIALVLAMRAGFQAVELEDENGAVWLVDGNVAIAKWRLVRDEE